MRYCNACAENHCLPKTGAKSVDTCEICCLQHALCNDSMYLNKGGTMLKRKQKVKPESMSSIKTFDEGWAWLKKNGWSIYLGDSGIKEEEPIYIHADRGNGYKITVKAHGKSPFETMRGLLGKIEEHQLF